MKFGRSLIASVFVLSLLVGLCGCGNSSEPVSSEMSSTASTESTTTEEEYLEQLKLAQYSMLSIGAEAEGVCNLIKSIWYDAIFDEYSFETALYVYGERNFKEALSKEPNDFNTALGLYFQSEDYKTAVSKIEEGRIDVARTLKELKNVESPPELYQDAYELVLEMNEYYEDLIGLVEPTGSLQDYNDAFVAADSEFIDLYEKLEIEFKLLAEE